MRCLFCSSGKHPTPDCNICVTIEERQARIRENNRCLKCLSLLKYHPWSGMKCEKIPKCFTCFSRDHHTVFCPDRFTVHNFFSPNIDKDLFSRFLKILTIEEKYFMAFSFPSFFSLTQIKPLNVFATQWEHVLSLIKFRNADLVIVDNLDFGGTNGFNISLNNTSFTSLTAFRIKNLKIRHSPFSSEIFLQLLSFKTKTLKCENAKFQPPIMLNEIIKMAPNLEEIYFCKTNIANGNLWPNDLLKFSHLKQLHLSIDGLDFCVATLATLTKTKSVNITLYISEVKAFFKKKSFDMIKTKLSPHFVPAESGKSLTVVLNQVFYCNFKLNNV